MRQKINKVTQKWKGRQQTRDLREVGAKVNPVEQKKTGEEGKKGGMRKRQAKTVEGEKSCKGGCREGNLCMIICSLWKTLTENFLLMFRFS